jgi:hypothetical protein
VQKWKYDGEEARDSTENTAPVARKDQMGVRHAGPHAIGFAAKDNNRRNLCFLKLVGNVSEHLSKSMDRREFRS